MENLSFLNNADPQAIEDLYNQYLTDPSSVEYGWRRFFEGFEFSKTDFTAKNQELFGQKFIILPNPMYGAWEKPLYDYKEGISDADKTLLLKSKLKTQ